jgi:electron transfer flavoprotein beta subunit
MRIAVCLKEVLDTRLPIPLPWHSGAVSQGTESPVRLTNPADRAALEIAFQFKAQAGEPSAVEAFSVCTAGDEGALVYALARGADRAERIEPWTEPAAPVSTALALADRFANAGFDLVCCGDETMENASAVVGPLLAECLGWGQVTSVCEVREWSGGRCVLARKLEGGHREVVEAEAPLVVTFLADAVRPRYVSRRLIDRARSANIPVFSVEMRAQTLPALGWPAAEQKVAPRARVKKRFAPEAHLAAADRIKAIMAGGNQSQAASSATVLEGESSYLVEQLYRFLKHHQFV